MKFFARICCSEQLICLFNKSSFSVYYVQELLKAPVVSSARSSMCPNDNVHGEMIGDDAHNTSDSILS